MPPPNSAPELTKIEFPPIPEKHKFDLEFLFNYTLNLPTENTLFPVGANGEGHLTIITEQGTRIAGPKIKGSFATYGQDFMTVRPDGVGKHLIRCVILTDDGSRISYHYEARSDWGPDGYKNAVAGNVPEGLRIIGAPHMLSGDKKYEWLNRCQCVLIGEVYGSKGFGSFDVYAIR